MRSRTQLVAVCLLLAVVLAPAQQSALGPAERIADGVLLYRLQDPGLLTPPGPVSVQALRLDPRKVTLHIDRGTGDEPAAQTVGTIAAQQADAIAAINAGFFSMKTGQPTDLLKIDGEVVSGTGRPRGAVGILDSGGITTLIFDRLIVATRSGPPAYRPLLGTSPAVWARTGDAISGAGLLRLNGREFTDWSDEIISGGFDTTRHPRTMIGTDAQGDIWLVTVDGRNPLLSFGMTFAELQRLAQRLGLRSALNLDGGGSTTMWVTGKIVNHPSDPEGPRRVSDAILVVPRRR